MLVSNSAAPEILNLYAQGFQITRVMAARAIAANGAKRGSVRELIIMQRRTAMRSLRASSAVAARDGVGKAGQFSCARSCPRRQGCHLTTPPG